MKARNIEIAQDWGYFEVLEEDQVVGKMAYKKLEGNILRIEHTEVDELFKGRGIGKLLVKTAVEYARYYDLKIVPVCPYAKRTLLANEEYHDILK